MPSTLAASTTNRKWRLEVNSGTISAPVWTTVYGRTDFKPNLEPTLQDDSDFDGDGFKSQTVTALAWVLEFKVSRKSQASAPTQYDPGQELLRLTANQMGTANSIEVRWYEMEPGGPRIEAYQGRAAVSWTPDGGGMDALDSVSVALTGQGQRVAITHPDTAAAAAPTITSLTPSTAAVAGGTLVMITGTNLGTATDVTVGGVSVPVANWEVADGQKIALIAPAKTAGSQPVIVINPGGSSPSSPLTYA